MVLFYSFNAALLVGNLSSAVRKTADLQGMTLVATVLCAAPYGLNVTCLSLVVRSWVMLPVIAGMFQRVTGIVARRALLRPRLR